VALDGRSGVGKSTLAAEVAARLGGSVIDGDDFYVGGTAAHWDGLSPIERARQVIDWRRQRLVLETLALGRTASWLPYDWQIDNGSLASQPLTCPASPIVILEGAYSARPELADLFDLRVLLQADAAVRRERLEQRDGVLYHEDWCGRWLDSEDHYFGTVMPPEAFDLVLESADLPR
jgi:uridine kinase